MIIAPRIIISGSRDFTSFDVALFALGPLFSHRNDVTIVSGTCRGADLVGEEIAKHFHFNIKKFPANWKPNGVFDRGAGHKRNRQMAHYADSLISFWDGVSPGTFGMINYMKSLDKPTRVFDFNGVQIH